LGVFHDPAPGAAISLASLYLPLSLRKLQACQHWIPLKSAKSRTKQIQSHARHALRQESTSMRSRRQNRPFEKNAAQNENAVFSLEAKNAKDGAERCKVF
jgi:hypothetical protein